MTKTLESKTSFAPGDRSGALEVLRAHETLERNETLLAVMDAMPIMIMLLDRNRQIIAANRLVVDAFEAGCMDNILGMRPGELVHCTHAWDNEQGCGTSKACRYCRAVATVLSAQKGSQTTQDCRISLEDGGVLDLRVTATPFSTAEEQMTLVAIEDISHQKRREILERTFFHDILNTAGNIQGLMTLVHDDCEDERHCDLVTLANDLSDQLIDEITSQRDLLQAEQGQLDLSWKELSLSETLTTVRNRANTLECAQGKKIVLDLPEADRRIITDPSLLGRVLFNLLKNALEASTAGQIVTLGYRPQNNEAKLWVHNPAVMSEEVRHQVFQRSFSTKGQGRGVGTYSVKLLGEHYLRGKVELTARAGEGTTFTLTIPDRPATT